MNRLQQMMAKATWNTSVDKHTAMELAASWAPPAVAAPTDAQIDAIDLRALSHYETGAGWLRAYARAVLALATVAPHPASEPTSPTLIEWEDAHSTAWQAAAAFRPPYFGDNFRAHNWVVEAIRSAHMDGQRFAQGLPKINRAVGGEPPQELHKQRAALTPPTSSSAEPIGYLPEYELSRLHSGHDANLRSARFGPSPLDGDVPVYLATPPAASSAEPGEPS